jgi:hypothetical protein
MLLQPREYKGIFKFPNIDTQYAGKLQIFSNKEENLLGKLTIQYLDFGDGFRIDRIKNICKVVIGTIEDNIKVTLIVHSIYPSSKSNIFTFIILLEYIFFNTHLETKGDLDKDIKFDEMIIHFTNIHTWIGYFTIYKDGKTMDPSFRFQISEEVEINFFYDLPLSNLEKQIENLGNLYVKLSSKTEKSLSEFLTLVHTVQDFLNFFYFGEVLIDALYSRLRSKDEIVSIFYRSTYPEKMNKLGPVVFNFRELFSSDKTKTNDTNAFPIILNKWFNLVADPKKGLMLDYFFARMYDHGSYQEGLFLSLCGFIESYYKYNLSNVDIDKKSKRKEIFNKIEPSLLGLKSEEYGSKLYNHVSGFVNIPFQEMIKSSCMKNLEVASLWSSTIYYFDIEIIKNAIKKYPSRNKSKKILEDILVKAKDIQSSPESNIRRMKINCLRIELSSRPGVIIKLIRFSKFLFYNEFPREITKYRNEFAHGNFNIEKRENWEYYDDKLTQLVKVLHFISYLCILSELGFKKKQLISLFNLDAPNQNRFALIFGFLL